ILESDIVSKSGTIKSAIMFTVQNWLGIRVNMTNTSFEIATMKTELPEMKTVYLDSSCQIIELLLDSCYKLFYFLKMSFDIKYYLKSQNSASLLYKIFSFNMTSDHNKH